MKVQIDTQSGVKTSGLYAKEKAAYSNLGEASIAFCKAIGRAFTDTSLHITVSKPAQEAKATKTTKKKASKKATTRKKTKQ